MRTDATRFVGLLACWIPRQARRRALCQLDKMPDDLHANVQICLEKLYAKNHIVIIASKNNNITLSKPGKKSFRDDAIVVKYQFKSLHSILGVFQVEVLYRKNVMYHLY